MVLKRQAHRSYIEKLNSWKKEEDLKAGYGFVLLRSIILFLILKDLLIKTAIALKCLITFELLILSICFENSCRVFQLFSGFTRLVWDFSNCACRVTQWKYNVLIQLHGQQVQVFVTVNAWDDIIINGCNLLREGRMETKKKSISWWGSVWIHSKKKRN